MEMACRDRWTAEIEEMRRLLAEFPLTEECKWGKPTYTADAKNVVILQGFKEYFALGFFQGALLKDPKKLLVQLGQTQAGRVMKFTSANEIASKAATIKAYVREAITVEKAGLRVEKKKTEEFTVPEELTAKFRSGPRFKKAFDALTAPAAAGLSLPLRWSETARHASGSNRKSHAGDSGRTRISRAPINRPREIPQHRSSE